MLLEAFRHGVAVFSDLCSDFFALLGSRLVKCDTCIYSRPTSDIPSERRIKTIMAISALGYRYPNGPRICLLWRDTRQIRVVYRLLDVFQSLLNTARTVRDITEWRSHRQTRVIQHEYEGRTHLLLEHRHDEHAPIAHANSRDLLQLRSRSALALR